MHGQHVQIVPTNIGFRFCEPLLLFSHSSPTTFLKRYQKSPSIQLVIGLDRAAFSIHCFTSTHWCLALPVLKEFPTENWSTLISGVLPFHTVYSANPVSEGSLWRVIFLSTLNHLIWSTVKKFKVKIKCGSVQKIKNIIWYINENLFNSMDSTFPGSTCCWSDIRFV